MKSLATLFATVLAIIITPLASLAKTADGQPLILLIGDPPSHGPGLHEYNAGVLLFAKCLAQNESKAVEVRTFVNGDWPEAPEIEQADSILIYSDGGDKHPALRGERLAQLGSAMKRGCGFVCVHYALELPKERGSPLPRLARRLLRSWLVDQPTLDG